LHFLGTTWTQEVVYLIKTDINIKKATEKTIDLRFPFLENPNPGLNTIANSPSPRFIKTHLPYDMLPTDVSKAKLIYITRNPKDTVVSNYHFFRLMSTTKYKGTFKSYLKKFQTDTCKNVFSIFCQLSNIYSVCLFNTSAFFINFSGLHAVL